MQHSTDAPDGVRPLTPEKLRTLITLCLAEHVDVLATRPTTSVYSDRLGISVTDFANQVWRIHVLTTPQERA